MEYILTLIMEDGTKLDWKDFTGFPLNPIARNEKEMHQLLKAAQNLDRRVVDAEWKPVLEPPKPII